MKKYKKLNRTMRRFLRRYTSLAYPDIRRMSLKKMSSICDEYCVMSLPYMLQYVKADPKKCQIYDSETGSSFCLPKTNSNDFFSLDAY